MDPTNHKTGEKHKFAVIDKGSMSVKMYYSDCVLQTTTTSLMNSTESCDVEEIAYTPEVLRNYTLPYTAAVMRRALTSLPASVRISLYHLEQLRDHMYGVENNHANVTDATLRQHVVDVVQSYPEKMRPVARECMVRLEDLEVNEHTFPECVELATRIAESWYEQGDGEEGGEGGEGVVV